jgi:hypothetical protein
MLWKCGKTESGRIKHTRDGHINRYRDWTDPSTIGFMMRITLVLLFANVLPAAANNNPSDALRKADHYANVYNWASAKPLFLTADQGLPHGSPEQIHAHLGYLPPWRHVPCRNCRIILAHC